MFISGITARAADGSIVGEGDIELQARTIFENMRRLLEADGARIDDVVKTTTYVRSAADIPKVGAIRLEYFHGTPPASTSVEVAGLFDARQLVEIDAIAAPANDPT
jgi:enamine deaminase RidA (YjgF/YER057c/UK114 family)